MSPARFRCATQLFMKNLWYLRIYTTTATAIWSFTDLNVSFLISHTSLPLINNTYDACKIPFSHISTLMGETRTHG
jgi:hypothetical protein